MKIVLATRNKGKIEEIRHYLEGLDVELLSLDDFEGMHDVVEDGDTLEENAVKKAREVSEFTKLPALADDSGLEVDALNGEPGVYSARFAGEGCTYDDNNKKLIELLKDIPREKRTAHFRTVLALYIPNEKTQTVEGRIDGLIIDEFRGTNGFGYDPIFYIPHLNKTFAELTLDEKNKISHRANALCKIKTVIENIDWRLETGN